MYINILTNLNMPLQNSFPRDCNRLIQSGENGFATGVVVGCNLYVYIDCVKIIVRLLSFFITFLLL